VTKPLEDEVTCGKVVGGVLDHGEHEAVNGKGDRARRGRGQRCGGGNQGSLTLSQRRGIRLPPVEISERVKEFD
jgi:hypothetical protein